MNYNSSNGGEKLKKNKLLIVFLLFLLTSCSLNELKVNTITTSSTNTTIEESVYYTVTFLNYDDSILGSISVKEGETANYTFLPPKKPDGDEFSYQFIGFDKDLNNISSDIFTHAEFKEIPKVNWGEITWF